MKKDEKDSKVTPKDPDKPIIHQLEPMKTAKITINLPVIIGAVAVILAGVFTGYALANNSRAGGSVANKGTTAEGLKKSVGIADEKTFKDSAEGILREGGMQGEGTHHLERAGGPSQDVYLTSSTVPLADYVGKKVKVWGETFAAKSAGWFMDVGKLELEQ